MNDWIEPRTRIPLAGIIAMVLVVAVVAVFLKFELSPLFPSSTVTVQSASDPTAQSNVGGKASSSFQGLREINLVRKERLQGVVNLRAQALAFTVDAPGQSLLIAQNGRQEEVLLKPDGNALVAVFEYDGAQTRVDIDASGKSLVYSHPGSSQTPVTVALATVVSYEGYFTFKNEQYLFQFFPQGSHAMIGSRTPVDVSLTENNGVYSGVWNDGTKSRPLSIDTSRLVTTIEDVW